MHDLTPLPLMRLSAGFWSFKTFAAAVELGLFTRLAGGRAVTAEQAMGELGLPRRPARLLLAACASLGLLEAAEDGEGYRNSALAEEFLVEGKPYYFGGFVRFMDHREYQAFGELVHALRTDRPTAWDPDKQDSPFVAEDPVMMSMFWEAMHSLSTFTAQALGAAYDFGAHSRLLDVGGGSGAYPIELCRRYPDLSAAVYDLPHVTGIAAEKIAAAGLTGRVGTVSGDFFTDAELPAGYDAIVLSNILHDHDEATGRELLRKSYRALEPGGAVLICEQLLNPEETGPPEAALMGIQMLVETLGGENHSDREYAAWLGDAGFTEARVIEFISAGANGAVVATKPEP